MGPSWQDLLTMVAGMIFCAALIPTVWHQWKVKTSTVPVSTSLATSIAVTALIPVYISFGLWVGTTTLATNLLLWVMIWLQRWRYGGRVIHVSQPLVEVSERSMDLSEYPSNQRIFARSRVEAWLRGEVEVL